MARTKSKSIYQKIEETRSQIESTEQQLIQLKAQLEELLKEKDELEMKQAWQLIKNKGVTIEELTQLLLETK